MKIKWILDNKIVKKNKHKNPFLFYTDFNEMYLSINSISTFFGNFSLNLKNRVILRTIVFASCTSSYDRPVVSTQFLNLTFYDWGKFSIFALVRSSPSRT